MSKNMVARRDIQLTSIVDEVLLIITSVTPTCTKWRKLTSEFLKYAYNQRDFTTFFQLLKLRPDSVSHYTIHRCQVLARYKEGIKRGFETKFSNGRTEGINNRIKTIKRVACGYRYFTAFKTRIYLIIGHQIQTN